MTEIWSDLRHHFDAIRDRRIASLFSDVHRFSDFSADVDGLWLDYSKTNIDETARKLLLDLMKTRQVDDLKRRMMRGDKINSTEKRAVLHVALRAPENVEIVVDGKNAVPGVHRSLQKMADFCDKVRSGTITNSDGEPFTDIVNIGIGGSDLGPVMAVLALAPYHDGPKVHFVSNVDGAQITDVLKNLNPKRTFFVLVSKSFTTIETMTNAHTALGWLKTGIGERASDHLAAVSSAEEKTQEYGIPSERVFGFEDWVGGRYSLWGPVGLSIMLAIGPDSFREFLRGASAMDQHFLTAQGKDNMPLIMALVGIWHRNICGYATRAILPYEQRLSRLPAYLQQLDMESNGKSVTADGQVAAQETVPVVWGEPGTNGQHAFYQMLHQGTSVVPCEFLLAKMGHESELKHQHDLLKANCLAQSKAMMDGRTFAEAAEIVKTLGYDGEEATRQALHRVFPGNRPSITLIYPKLTPYVLGQLIALFEHRTFVEGAIWGLNSFDQWGVELGKNLATRISPLLKSTETGGLDGSTAGLIDLLGR